MIYTCVAIHSCLRLESSVWCRVPRCYHKMDDEQHGNIQHDGRGTRGSEGAGNLIGSQYGSAAGSDPAGLMTPAPPVDARAPVPLVGPHLVSLAAVTTAAVNFGTTPATRRRASETGSPLLDAERRRRAELQVRSVLDPTERLHSRSPRPVTPPARASAAPPGSAPPASPDWSQDLPGHGASLEELRGHAPRDRAAARQRSQPG